MPWSSSTVTHGPEIFLYIARYSPRINVCTIIIQSLRAFRQAGGKEVGNGKGEMGNGRLEVGTNKWERGMERRSLGNPTRRCK